jgi:hypothetical protein
VGKFTKKEIQQYVAQEVRRKTPIDEEKLLEAKQLDKFNAEMMARATWKEVELRLSALEVLPGSQKYEKARIAWREYQLYLQEKLKGR